jgi:hypothetical protein
LALRERDRRQGPGDTSARRTWGEPNEEYRFRERTA